MTPDLRRPPVDILHMPTIHDGMSYVGQSPDWIIRPVAAAEVRMFAASDSPELRARQQAMINQQIRAFPKGALEIRSSAVVLENARFTQGLAQIADRFWLNGASGSRVRTKFENSNPEPWRRDRYLGSFRRSRAKGRARIPICDHKDASKLDVAIELKNGFNYYHFSTETLGSLAHYLHDGTNRPITLHLPNSSVKGFMKRFIDAVFPSLSDRVRFDGQPAHYDRVRSVYSHQHYLYAANDDTVDAVLNSPGVDPRWPEMARDPHRIKRTAMFSFDTSLRLLRDEALSQTRPSGALPRLVWMGRDEGGDARSRGIEGHEPLLEELSALGFEQVAFEHLSPLEQVATMNAADIVIAPHGAGLANMVYARPGATIIEIGTRQTQLHRWGDFLKCAHVSRCRYDTVFADIEGIDDLTKVPKMSDGHRGVRVSRNATERIIAIVGETLGRRHEVHAGSGLV